MEDEMVEGQPFAGHFILNHIYYHVCHGYYDYLDVYPNHGTSPCPSCHSTNTDLVESTSDSFRLMGYCHSCKLVWDSHMAKCECKSFEFEEKNGLVRCIHCGLNEPTIQDLLFRLEG